MTPPKPAGDKTAEKYAKPSGRNGNRLPLGAHPGNTGGKKGRSGRKPNEFKDFLAKARQNPKVQKALLTALKDPESRGFSSALKVLTDYDEQKPGQKVDVTSAGEKLPGVVVLPPVEEST